MQDFFRCEAGYECFRQKILGKETIIDVQFTEPCLMSVTLGKDFVECFPEFAECFRHSAKQLCSVVHSVGQSKKIHRYTDRNICDKSILFEQNRDIAQNTHYIGNVRVA
jgi:hypothetical protein